jgi:hypothetical protein
VLPFKNCTEPVAADGVTVALSVTTWPTVEGEGLDVSVMLALAFTVSWSALEALAAVFESPP